MLRDDGSMHTKSCSILVWTDVRINLFGLYLEKSSQCVFSQGNDSIEELYNRQYRSETWLSFRYKLPVQF